MHKLLCAIILAIPYFISTLVVAETGVPLENVTVFPPENASECGPNTYLGWEGAGRNVRCSPLPAAAGAESSCRYALQGEPRPGLVQELDCNTGTSAFPGDSETPIEPYGECVYIDNASSNTYFVPLNTKPEWLAFKDHKPEGISFRPCSSLPDGGSCKGGRLVGGYCWFRQGNTLDCDRVCAIHGRTCDLSGTKDFAGSGGTDANCQALMAAFGGDDNARKWAPDGGLIQSHAGCVTGGRIGANQVAPTMTSPFSGETITADANVGVAATVPRDTFKGATATRNASRETRCDAFPGYNITPFCACK